MAINLSAETLISFSQAADLVPFRRPHISAIYRWWRHGVRGIRLEAAVVGGLRVTSKEAVERFLERLNATKEGAAA